MELIDRKAVMNLKAVVLGTDFSKWSENAGRYASALAAYFSCRLFVTHAFILSQAALEVEVERSHASHQRKHLEATLCATVSSLRSQPGDATPVLLEGDPKVAIPAFADEHAPSIIALGTHGGGRIERRLLGSVAEQILRSTRWPTLTVGPHAAPYSTTVFPFKRLLYATDLSFASTHAAAYAILLAEAFGATIDVLNVVRREAIEHPDRLADIHRYFYATLEQLIPQHAHILCHPRTFVDVGRAHDQILEHVRSRSIDLLVVGLRKTAHAKSEAGISSAFQLIVDASCPVLTITHN